MTEGVELHLWDTYQGFDIMDTLRAVKVTQENIRALEELTGGDLCEFTGTNGAKLDDGERYLWLPNDPAGEHVACDGDYLTEEPDGHYKIHDKTAFEKRYAKRV